LRSTAPQFAGGLPFTGLDVLLLAGGSAVLAVGGLAVRRLLASLPGWHPDQLAAADSPGP
jgi:hypothetical protein